MALSIISWLATVCVFGSIGWIAASQRNRRSGMTSFGALFVVATLGFIFGGHTIVFGIEKFWMMLSWASVSACVGAGIRLALTNRRLRRAETP